ncbi:putative transposase [Candidatus Nitrososphaera gargensis Ga9.2]|uniref:Putative transposase n=1 Tax=Nitrososphaera gargensis (strain Ga9.2) TaxID=1237085 RepID=K0IDJ3_NITGG|nr:putative transposase [Candidatus Nitrososphaera gargensis Ga9.2]
MSEYDMNYALTELKEQHPWLRKYYYHSKMLQMVAKQVAAAAIKVVAKGRKLSYRKDEDFNSFTYNQSGFKIENDRLVLSKIAGGSIRIVLHRQPVNVKQVTICRSKAGNKWYAVVACDVLRRLYSTIIRYVKPAVGIDVGITKFCHDSDNHVVENPQFLTKMLKPLRRAHRRVSRKQSACLPDCTNASITSAVTFYTSYPTITAAATT